MIVSLYSCDPAKLHENCFALQLDWKALLSEVDEVCEPPSTDQVLVLSDRLR